MRFACFVFALAALPIFGRPPPPVDPGLPPYPSNIGLQGTLTISRVASTSGIVDSWARGFARHCPGVRVVQTEKDEANSLLQVLRDLGSGRVQIGPFPRDIQPSEMKSLKAGFGGEPLGVTIATGSYDTPSNGSAVAIYVNAANPLSKLTMQQLDAILSSNQRRGYPERIDRWGQLGLTGDWGSLPIHRYGMVTNNQLGAPHGIVFYLMERLMLGGTFRSDMIQVPDTGIGRGNNRAFDEVVRRVAEDRGGIGYAGFNNCAPGIKALALSENPGGPFCEGSYENVLNRTYPLIRDIRFYVKPQSGRPLDPLVREFLFYALSREGQEAVADDPAGLLPLPAGFAARERGKLR